MSRAVYTYERHNLGDQLIFLHLLRSLAKSQVSTPFVHFCNGCHIPQLTEVVSDLPNIMLEPFESPLWEKHGQRAICVWKNHEDHWVRSPLRWNWSEHTLDHHRWTARRMGFESPFTCREHLLFDWPSLNTKPLGLPIKGSGFDFFVCNSEPSSGQFGPMKEHGSGYLDQLVLTLVQAGKSVVISKPLTCDEPDEELNGELYCLSGPEHFTISQIGNMSLRCKNIIGIATGPLWPCANTTNHHTHERRRFIAMLDNQEILNLPHWEQCSNVEDVFAIARQEGWVK